MQVTYCEKEVPRPMAWGPWTPREISRCLRLAGYTVKAHRLEMVFPGSHYDAWATRKMTALSWLGSLGHHLKPTEVIDHLLDDLQIEAYTLKRFSVALHHLEVMLPMMRKRP